MDTALSVLPAWALSPGLLVLKVTLVLVGAGILTLILRRASAGHRHLIWSTAVGGTLLLALLSASSWRLEVSVLPAVPIPDQPVAQPGRISQQESVGQPPWPGRSPATAVAPPATALTRVESAPGWFDRWNWQERLLALWLTGALLVALRFPLGSFLVARMVRAARPLEGSEWQRPLMDVADRLALARLPALRLSSRLAMPFACGLIRPVILLPAEAETWSAERRQAVLCHELAHLRRHDLLVNLLAQCALALFWFHPLLWVALRRLRVESERACDDLVLGIGTRASDYADHLLQILRGVPRLPVPVTVLPFAQRGEFEGRVLAILERDAPREPAGRRGAATILSLGFLVVVPLAVAYPVRKVRPAQASESWPAQLIATNVDPTARATSPESGTRSAARPQPSPSAARRADPVPAPGPTRAAAVAADTGDQRVVVRSLMDALGDTVASVRENAAYSLGRLEATVAAAALGRLVERDPSARVREMSAWALGTMHGTAGVAGLGAAVGRDTSSEVRATAVWALAQIEAVEGLPALGNALRDPSVEVRSRAAWAIGTLSPSRAPAALLAATADTSAVVRARAAWALGRISDTTTVPVLARLVEDPSSSVREVAFWALGNQEPTEATQAALLKALQASDPSLRAQAARALSGARGRPWPMPMPMPR